MAELEGALLAGRPPRFVQLPTAAAAEGSASVARWVSLGAEQARRLGVEAVPVLVGDRVSADDEAMAARIDGAGLIYLSGGDPTYLADTLRGTRAWTAIARAWRDGAALAGCSAGAMALTSWVPDIRRPDAEPVEGLGVVPGMRVLPHFDRLRSWAPGMADAIAARVPDGVVLVGIDEETAIVSDGGSVEHWVVRGRQAAWVYFPDGPKAFGAGDEIVL
jgi:cyanophycinase-like exopeptidase